MISPDELNAHIQTVIVAPLTPAGKPYPFRVSCQFENKAGLIVLDQIRTVDRERLVRRLGAIPPPILQRVLGIRESCARCLTPDSWLECPDGTMPV